MTRTTTSTLDHTLRDEARRRLGLLCREKSYRVIADEANLSTPWLCQFLKGHYLDPDAHKVEAILNLCLGGEPCNLVGETLQRYRNRPVWQELGVIAKATGISPEWISSFGAGRVKAPGINKVETLLNYLRRNANVLS